MINLLLSEEKYREIEEERTYAYTQHQLTISTAKDIGRIVNACAQLPQEHWPKISSDQRDWLASSVTESLSNLDLDDKIEQKEDDTWSEPNWLRPLLDIIDAYYIKVSDDLPLILALKAFSYGPINKYFCRETLSKSAENELTVLLNGTHQRIVHNVLMFLRTTTKMPVPVSNVLPKIALNCGYQWQLRAEAIDLLEGLAASTKTLDALSKDADSRIRDLALKKLVDQQHRPTICRRLAKLTDEELIQGNVEPPGYSPLDWIGRIKSEFAIKPLEDMRSRASKLALWSLVGSVAEVIARIDKPSAGRIIREQLLPDTPSNIRSHFEQRANHFERTARIEAAQQTSFEQIIEKLKGTTSMISIKVWCEGPSDVHIVEKLLRDLDQSEIARTIDNVGGWTNLMHKVPARMLDGCREAILIVDGDKGRNRSMAGRPYSKDAEKIKRRFAKHQLKLYVLERYGIEDYIPRHAYETVLGRDLSDYFPVPHDKNLKDHCKEVVPKGLPFNPKGHNEKVAQHISPKDFEGTDLMDILRDICNMAEVARR